MFVALIIATLGVAYANGANANFKGVASLFGSGTTSYWTAVRWATITTAAGCAVAIFGSSAMLSAFSGKGLVPDALAVQPTFLFAVAAGAAIANLLATRLGFPVSTKHMLMGRTPLIHLFPSKLILPTPLLSESDPRRSAALKKQIPICLKNAMGGCKSPRIHHP